MPFYDSFERFCKEKGVTPTQAARENGITQQTVSHWKTRGSTPKVETIQKLADYFDVPIYMLLNDNERAIYEAAEVGLVVANYKTGYRFTDREGKLVRLFNGMNNAGGDIVLSVAEAVAGNHRYRAETAPQPPAGASGDTDTPAQPEGSEKPADGPETPPEGE